MNSVRTSITSKHLLLAVPDGENKSIMSHLLLERKRIIPVVLVGVSANTQFVP